MMATKEKTATLSAKECGVLVDLIRTYAADRDDVLEHSTGLRRAHRGASGVCPKAVEKTLLKALHRLERASGVTVNNYNYWLIEECDSVENF